MSEPRANRYTLEQRAFMVEHYFRTSSYKITLGRFKKRFKEMPDVRTIQRVVERFQNAFTLEDETRSGRPRALSADDRTKLREHVDENPGISARRAAQELGFKRETVRTTLKDEGYYPYRITMLHEIKLEDYSSRYDYCDWFLEKFGRDIQMIPMMFFTDEAWFHLSGYVNAQNYRIWSTKNPHVFEETSLHPLKVGVWCAISQRRVIGPIFFEKSVDSDTYTNIIQDFIALLEEDERYAWFQQDGAPAHTAGKTMKVLAEFFEDRVISKGKWPARSPDLSPPDFFLWGYLKDNVYRNKPETIDKLKEEIEIQVHAIGEDTCKKVFENMIRRMDECQGIGGGHFQHQL